MTWHDSSAESHSAFEREGNAVTADPHSGSKGQSAAIALSLSKYIQLYREGCATIFFNKSGASPADLKILRSSGSPIVQITSPTFETKVKQMHTLTPVDTGQVSTNVQIIKSDYLPNSQGNRVSLLKCIGDNL